ncbi:MAG: hypothetical protein M1479_07060 [Actinobacteria bacterium]|nr:hypothetical protein [Cyanobacteriota bacterium]MCL5772015.1 hypothetical protein [Actinomycetota bacterium]
MGFHDSRTLKPNAQWIFLKLLAKRNGKINWSDSEATANLKKTKQRTSDSLKEFFQIKQDPFYLYKKEKEYRIKISLLPE